MDEYRDENGEVFTEDEMRNIFVDDISNLDDEQREEITFEDWLSEMLGWGRYSLVDEANIGETSG